MMNTRALQLIAVGLAAGLALAAWARAEEPPSKDQAPPNVNLRFKRYMSGTETCLTCHGDYNIITTRGAQKNESLWVSSDRFLGSVHSRLGCTSCHTNIEGHGHRLAQVETNSTNAVQPGEKPASIDAGARVGR